MVFLICRSKPNVDKCQWFRLQSIKHVQKAKEVCYECLRYLIRQFKQINEIKYVYLLCLQIPIQIVIDETGDGELSLFLYTFLDAEMFGFCRHQKGQPT
ncbi:hypothetical protein AEQ18_01295 [Enterococcus sp. RIT-PI-f]|nr:hypothetical protein AEQ18_01295 [Enterococcus sp. RIT-PI-f]